MKQTTHYPHEFEEKGFKELLLNEMSECQLEKSVFVERYLSPAVKNSDSGWYGVEYVSYTNGEEFIFFIDYSNNLSRGICVTANSKTAIATAVFDNID